MPESVEEAQQPQKQGGGALRTLVEFVIVIAVALVLAWGIQAFVVRPFEIPSGSMEETIQIGDRVLSEKVSGNAHDPQQFDIVTFNDIEDPDRTLIKRVIATGGQSVDLRDGRVYVDGELVEDEQFTHGKPSEPLNPSPSLNQDIEYPYTVPQGYIWVMGDNRTNSSDSRYFGPVPIENVSGHAFFRYWPFDRLGSLS